VNASRKRMMDNQTKHRSGPTSTQTVNGYLGKCN
jgi:hypothetical protein